MDTLPFPGILLNNANPVDRGINRKMLSFPRIIKNMISHKCTKALHFKNLYYHNNIFRVLSQFSFECLKIQRVENLC